MPKKFDHKFPKIRPKFAINAKKLKCTYHSVNPTANWRPSQNPLKLVHVSVAFRPVSSAPYLRNACVSTLTSPPKFLAHSHLVSHHRPIRYPVHASTS